MERSQENRITFLRTFVEMLSENITGTKGRSFQDHINYWKTRPELLPSTLDQWKKQLDDLHNQVANSKKIS